MAITVNKSANTTDVVYALSSENGSKKSFIVAASGLNAPERLEVEHNLRPVGAKGTDQHRFTFTKGDIDSVTGAFTQGSVEVTIRIPRAAGFTDVVVRDLTKQAQCLLANAFVDGLKNGITIEGDYSQSAAFVPA